MQKRIFVVVLFSIMLLNSSCSIEDKYAPINEYANIDLSQVPFSNLSDYGFFTGNMNALNPSQKKFYLYRTFISTPTKKSPGGAIKQRNMAPPGHIAQNCSKMLKTQENPPTSIEVTGR